MKPNRKQPSLGDDCRSTRVSHGYGLLLSLFGLFAVGFANASLAGDDVAMIEVGRKIYQQGILPSGASINGQRLDATLSGADAACIRCHRRSGMGGSEGNIAAPPITGRFLFATEERPLALLDARSPRDITQAHQPYDDTALIRAIATGVDINNKAMSPLMPRYALADRDIVPLVAYLRTLSANLSPGVSDETVRFATIITPGTDAKRRDILVDMMQSAFRQRNYSQTPRSGQMRMPLDSIPHKRRNWELDVWELRGEPSTWREQLTGYQQAKPVFAVISGVSTGTWTPVQEFCEQQGLPCMFPSIDLPDEATSFYSLHFSRGVALEAGVMARYLRERKNHPVARVIQLSRGDGVANGASAALRDGLAGTAVAVENRVFDPANPSAALKGLSRNDVLVLWLHPDDLRALTRLKTGMPGAETYISGRMAGHALAELPANWRRSVKMVYPYEIGEKRLKNLQALREWLETSGLPLVDETLQAEVFFNLLLLTDVTTQMLDNYYRDYFVERAEDMLGQGANVTSYPRLSLGANQRFASKGAYIVHVDKRGQFVADTDWIVP